MLCFTEKLELFFHVFPKCFPKKTLKSCFHFRCQSKAYQDARAVLQKHIDHIKWAQCAFSTEQLKGQRWMLNMSPKNCPPGLKKALTVTEQSQVLHFRLVIHCYNEAGRRLRASSRTRVRWASQAFDAHCDFACVFSALLDEGRTLSSWNAEKEEAVIKAFFQKNLGTFCESTFYVVFSFFP